MSKGQKPVMVNLETHTLLKKLAGDVPLSKYVKRLAEQELAKQTK